MSINAGILSIAAIAYFLLNGISHAAPVWTMVDCNAGGSTQDCHVLTDGNEVSIVDTGTVEATKRYFIPYLKKAGIKKVKNFYVSHPHDNHVGGLIDIMDSGVEIQNIYFNDPVHGHNDFAYHQEWWDAMKADAVTRGAKLHQVKKGDVIKTKNTRMLILEAPKSRQAEVNDYSVIMRWEAGGYSTLFTGDLSVELGNRLAGNPVFEADFYKAPHHGVTPIAPDAFSNTVNPVLAMVPQPKILERHPRGLPFFYWARSKLSAKGMITCTNGNNGHVSLIFEQTSVSVRPERNHGSCVTTRLYLTPKKLTKMPVNGLAMAPILNLLLD